MTINAHDVITLTSSAAPGFCIPVPPRRLLLWLEHGEGHGAIAAQLDPIGKEHQGLIPGVIDHLHGQRFSVISQFRVDV